MFTDTHCHLSDPKFADDLPQLLARARAAGVTRIVSIATDLDSARRTLAIAHEHGEVFAAIGLHPGEIPNVRLCDLKELAALAGDPKVVAIGEIGLDYFRLNVEQTSPSAHSEKTADETSAPLIIQQQKDLLWAQLDLAKQLRLPVVIHNRSADLDLLAILRAHAATVPPDLHPWGVMHCFGGTEQFANDCLALGLFISYTGILTFKNADPLREVAAKIPLDHVMLETDAPYLAPVPHRGERNESAHIPLIAEVLAQVKGVSVKEVARATTENARRLFRL